MRGPQDGEVAKEVDEALRRGCSIDASPTRSNHGILRGPDGRVVQRFPLGNADWRAGRNLRAAVKRALG